MDLWCDSSNFNHCNYIDIQLVCICHFRVRCCWQIHVWVVNLWLVHYRFIFFTLVFFWYVSLWLVYFSFIHFWSVCFVLCELYRSSDWQRSSCNCYSDDRSRRCCCRSSYAHAVGCRST